MTEQLLDDGLVACYLTVRILGVLQCLNTVLLAATVAVCVRWMTRGPVGPEPES